MYNDDSFKEILKDIQIIEELKIIETKFKTETDVDFITNTIDQIILTRTNKY